MNKIPFKDLNTLLTLKVLNGYNYRLTLYDNNAPQPSDIYENGKYTILTWRLSGSFNTLENKQYYNDTKEKLLLLLNAYDAVAEHLLKGITSNKSAFVAIHMKYSKHQTIHSLAEFNHIEDMRLGRTKIVFNKYTEMSTFKKIRLIGYNLAGEGNLTIERLDEAIHRHSKDYKDYLSNAYMAKAIYKWITHKMSIGDWYAQKKERVITISRKENALIQSSSIFEANYKRFNQYINFIGDTDLNASKLAKVLGLSRPTIYKFIKKYLNLKSVKSILDIGGVAKTVATWLGTNFFNDILINKGLASISHINRGLANNFKKINYNYDIVVKEIYHKELYYGKCSYPTRKEKFYHIRLENG